MSILASSGMIVGIMIGLIICVVLFRVSNSDKRVRTVYDERQEAVRGRAYRYGFYTIIILEAVMMCIKFSEYQFPFSEYLIHLFVMMAGFLVLCVYSVWQGVFWGINNNRTRYYVIYAVCTLLNIIPIVNAFRHGGLSGSGIDSLPYMNIMVVIFLAVIALTALVKKLADSAAKEED